MQKSFFFVLGILFLGTISYGQNDSLSDIEFISVKQYQPILRAAKKIEIKADIEQNKAAKPDLAYSLPSFIYKVEPNYYPARAIGIKSGKYEPLYDNYFRIGAGNYLTPLVEARLHNTQNKKYSFGGYVKHLSANAGKPENADFSDNYIGINGNRYLKKGKLSGELDYERHVVHFYGYDQDSFDFAKDSINQIFNDFNGSMGFSTNRRKFQFNSNFDFYTFSNMGGRENDFMVTLNPVIKLPKKQRIDIGFAFDYTTLSMNDTNLNRSFIRFNPVYYFRVKKINLKVGANVVYPTGVQESKVHFYPDLYADLFLVPKKLKAFASFSGDLNKTNLRDLSYTNPFLNNSFEVRNTSTNVDVLAGLKGLLGNKFDYLLQLRYQVQSDLPLFVTDTSVLNTFGLVYDQINTLGFTIGTGLRINEAFFMNVTGTFYNYQTKNEAEAWQLPQFDARVNLRYTLAKKLLVRLQMYALGDRIQFNPETNSVVPLNPFIDLNLHADYRYKENISFFVQVNNLTNARYQKWFNYPVLGLNALAGVTFSL